jgi:S-adenosylmethionine decarboxylase proenzyme
MGTHIILDLFGCPLKLLENIESVEKIITEIVKEIGFKEIKRGFHQFKPYGVTGFILMAESHLSIHTWPEKKAAAVDIFSCDSDKSKPEKAFELIIKKFKAKDYRKVVIER